jgi:predicted type IV restriction endonuclease
MLSEDIESIRQDLAAGLFQNEAAVSQGIVQRLLGGLGWPTYNTHVVWPEYSTENRRVDYALCHPVSKPCIFIEVKRVGQADGAERQLFEYAFHLGVPFVVLTDGQEWSFFVPGEAGNYAERRVYKLDLIDRDVTESVTRMTRYLAYEAVCSGEALQAARNDYHSVARTRQIQATLPEAWQKLVSDEDESLVELLADSTESLCGFRPEPDDVARFLSERVALHTGQGAQATVRGPKPILIPPQSPPQPSVRHRTTAQPTGPKGASSAYWFLLDGKRTDCGNATKVLIAVFEELAVVPTEVVYKRAAGTSP